MSIYLTSNSGPWPSSFAFASDGHAMGGALAAGSGVLDWATDFAPDERFRAEAVSVVGAFRQAVERVIYPVVDRLQNSRSLQAALGVDVNLSWQVFRLLGPVEALAAVPHVPAAVSFRKLLAAASKKGVADTLISEATAAFEAFEQFVQRSAGDREQFETTVMSFIDPAESAAVTMTHRKAAFKADSHFLGTVVDVLAIALLIHPGRTPGTHEFVGVRQMLGLRRLRANTDVLVDRWRAAPEPDREPLTIGDPLKNALDPVAAEAYGAVVLPEFCDDPLPPLVTTADPAGNVRTLLRHRDFAVGQRVDITTGRRFRDVPLDRTPDGRPLFQTLVEVARPTRLLVIDTFVHRPTWPDLVPRSGVYVHLPERTPTAAEQSGVRLPFAEALEFLGRASESVNLPGVPRHAELARHVCRRMGWRLDEMDLYRIRLEYPLMDGNVLCRLEAAKPT